MKSYQRLGSQLSSRLISLRKAHLSTLELKAAHQERRERGKIEAVERVKGKLVYFINEELINEELSTAGKGESLPANFLAYGYAYSQRSNGLIQLETYIPLVRLRYQRPEIFI